MEESKPKDPNPAAAEATAKEAAVPGSWGDLSKLGFDQRHYLVILRFASNAVLSEGKPIPAIASELFNSELPPERCVIAFLAQLIKDEKSFNTFVDALDAAIISAWTGKTNQPRPTSCLVARVLAKALNEESLEVCKSAVQEGEVKPRHFIAMKLLNAIALALLKRLLRLADLDLDKSLL